MQGPIRYCASCGHRCHCYSTNCKECVNDVCGVCKCDESKIETETDAKSWNDYMR